MSLNCPLCLLLLLNKDILHPLFPEWQQRLWPDNEMYRLIWAPVYTITKSAGSCCSHTIYSPCPAQTCFLAYADGEDPDQPVHPAVWSGTSLLANRIIGYYRMNEWWTKTWMILCTARWSESAQFAYVQRHIFAWRDPWDIVRYLESWQRPTWELCSR